jgi:3',5'-cyclic AMP phosphodiesterase CpdA
MLKIVLILSLLKTVYPGSETARDPGLNQALDNGLAEETVDKTLRFNSKKEFTILQLSDLHYGDDSKRDAMTTVIQETIIEEVKPDLVVITGDAVSGYTWNKKDKDYFKSKWEEFTAPYRKYKVRYAYVFGNHDIEADLSGLQMGELDKTHPYSMFAGDPTADPLGTSNYILPVLSSYPEAKSSPAYLLWMFDTRKAGCDGVEKSYGCIGQSQLAWFENQSQKFVNSDGSKIPGSAFFHIPLPEYMNVWNLHLTYGTKSEPVACPTHNSGAFERFRKTGNIKATFCGHDHLNDYGGKYQGIELVYGRMTGFGSYGPPNFRGGRVIKLKESLENGEDIPTVTFETYIVQEDKSTVKQDEPHWQGFNLYQTICKALVGKIVSVVFVAGYLLL